MGQEINRTQFDDQIFKEYQRRLSRETELLEKQLSQGVFSTIGEIGGYELESWLVDHNYFPSPINQAFLTRLNNPLVVHELSRFNVELNGAPMPLKGGALSAIASELNQNWQECQEVAHQMDSVLMMIGILPTVRQSDLCLANMSELKRYRALNEQVFKRRGGRPLHIRIDGREHLAIVHPDVMLEAAATSFQVHLQSAQHDAVRYFNASIIAAGPLVAASGNSPLLFDTDLWDETRIPLFEQSVEIGDQLHPAGHRVSFGCGYARNSLFECFAENLALHDVLLPILMDSPPKQFAHLRLHNGTIWRWVRPLIGFDPDGTPHLRIEQRVLPAGPTIADMIANAALFFGLARYLATLREAPEAVFSFDQARDNFYTAARSGLQAKLAWLDGSAVEAHILLLEEILPMARQGLETLGIDKTDIDHNLGILESRIKCGQTGAVWQRCYREKYQADSLHLVAAYLERQRSGAPVHEWAL
ncbi:glutamate--cysteine ligase [Nitrosomonas sp.]|uniref:glutamate--cysteine ligase n=1 Tax=Nitrosomonas sp. TaxID=42353 RepID=UPI001DC39328|nr:glutamate--cysteine ligase [Nitrosomonas sp.]MBX3616535.1 glutamate--cysteine ligase [Nitrosomonas sp.]